MNLWGKKDHISCWRFHVNSNRCWLSSSIGVPNNAAVKSVKYFAQAGNGNNIVDGSKTTS